MNNYPLFRSLHARGQTTTTLAAAIGSGRAHVSEVLANRPGHGHRTRPKLAPLLTEAERELLGWDASGKARTSDRRPETSDPAFGLPTPRSTRHGLKVVKPKDLQPDAILGVITPGMNACSYVQELEDYYGFPCAVFEAFGLPTPRSTGNFVPNP